MKRLRTIYEIGLSLAVVAALVLPAQESVTAASRSAASPAAGPHFKEALASLAHDGTEPLSWTFGTLCKGLSRSHQPDVWLTVNITFDQVTAPGFRTLVNQYTKKVYGPSVSTMTGIVLGSQFVTDLFIVPPGKNTAYLQVDGCSNEDETPPASSTSWTTTWSTKPRLQPDVIRAKQATTLRVAVYNPKIKLTGSPDGFPIIKTAFSLRFPPMRISVSGAGVARTVSYDPNTGREARIAVTPRQPGTLRISTSGQYYDSGSTTVQVGT